MFGFEDELQDDIAILEEKNKKLNFLLSGVIERLKKVQKYDIEPIRYYSDCWLDIDPCDDEFAKWIKVDDVEKIIKELTNAL